jgi:hypothetical protein
MMSQSSDRCPDRRVLVLVLLTALVASAGCVRAGGAAARTAARGAVKATESGVARILGSDAVRDARLAVKPLSTKRTVFRYTTAEGAAAEARTSVPAGSHMTSRGGSGRPLSASSAQARFGLPKLPTARETIVLPRGQPVRIGRVIGGRAGFGEITSAKKVNGASIKRIVRVP